MSLRVKGQRVLIRPAPEPEPDADALIVKPDAYQHHQVVMGRVEQLGDEPTCPHCRKGQRFEVSVGDFVTFAPSAGDFVYVDGEKFLILNHQEITAVVER